MVSIVPIVEGQGELAAIPILIRRVLASLGEARVQVRRPARENKGTLLKPGGLERFARAAAQRAPGDVRVLLLLDADNDAACTRGPDLQGRLQRALGSRHCAAVLAVREYENWLIGDAPSLSRDGAFRDKISRQRNPESVLDAKRWLNDRRTAKHRYDPVKDQARLTELIDLEVVRQRCPSFDKFWREVERLATD